MSQNVNARPHPIARSAMAENARNQRKKKRREFIGMQSKGEENDGHRVTPDTAEKKQNRTDAWNLLDILEEKRIENGHTPESAFSHEALACAKLGSPLLNLASGCEHYAAKKYFRAELAKANKETGDDKDAGRLAEYGKYFAAYQQEWKIRHPRLGDL